MKKEYDIWNEVLETLGFKFHEEYIMWRTHNLLVYFKDGIKARLYLDYHTGEITHFFIENNSDKISFLKEHKELFRTVKLKYLLD